MTGRLMFAGGMGAVCAAVTVYDVARGWSFYACVMGFATGVNAHTYRSIRRQQRKRH